MPLFKSSEKHAHLEDASEQRSLRSRILKPLIALSALTALWYLSLYLRIVYVAEADRLDGIVEIKISEPKGRTFRETKSPLIIYPSWKRTEGRSLLPYERFVYSDHDECMFVLPELPLPAQSSELDSPDQVWNLKVDGSDTSLSTVELGGIIETVIVFSSAQLSLDQNLVLKVHGTCGAASVQVSCTLRRWRCWSLEFGDLNILEFNSSPALSDQLTESDVLRESE